MSYLSEHPTQQTQGQSRVELAPVLTLAALVALTVYLIGSGPLPALGSSLAFWVISTWSICSLVRCSIEGKSSLHEAVFWLFVFVWLGLAPLVQLARGERPLPIPLDNSDYQFAGLIVLLGLVAYEVGRRSRRPNLPSSDVSFDFPPRRVEVFGLGALISCGVAVVVLGPAAFLVSRQTLSEALFTGDQSDNSSGALLSAIASVPIFVAFAVALSAHTIRGQLRPPSRLLLILLALANVAINNPISQSRFWFTTVWGTIFAIYLWPKIVAPFRYLPILLVLLAIFVFPFSDIFRYENPDDQRVQTTSAVRQLETKGDFDSLEQIAWGARVAERDGFTMGRQTLGALAFWVPRRLWPEKPRDTGIALAERANLENTSLSAPLWIEAYSDGGPLLLIIAFGILGYFHTRIKLALTTRQPVGAVVASFYQLVILRGSLIASMATSGALIVTYLFVARRRETRR